MYVRAFTEVPSASDDEVATLTQQAWQMEVFGKLSLVIVLAVAVKVLWRAFQKKADEARQDVHQMFQHAIKALGELREEFVRVSTLLAVVAERQQTAEGRVTQVEQKYDGLKERVLVLEHHAAASNSGVRKRMGSA